jgi:hypothetical protein
MVVVIEERADGIFLFRFAAGGRLVGDTWHATIEEAKQQAHYEFGGLLSEWKPVPEEVEDAFSFGLQT